MGLFSSDSGGSDGRAAKMVEKARSDTVTEERLTKTDTGGIVSRGIELSDEPILKYLEEDEQPHFIFFTSKSISPIKLPDTDSELSHISLATSAFCITDSQIVLVLSGVPDGSHPDKCVIIPVEEITDFELKPTGGGLGMDAHAIDVQVKSEIIQKICDCFDEDYEDFKNTETVRLMAINAFDESDIEEAGEYLNDALERQEIEAKEETKVTHEIVVSFYHFDNELNQESPDLSDQTYRILLGDSSIGFSGEEYEVEYGDIAEIYDFDTSVAEGIELILKDGTHIRMLGQKESSVINRFPGEIREYVQMKANPSNVQRISEYILGSYSDSSGTLRVEGWSEGPSDISADFDARSQTQGKSRGVEIGALSRSKSRSSTSVSGSISGEISDETYTSDIKMFKIYKDRLIVDSDIKLELYYSDIDNIFEQDRGVVLEVESTTFRVTDLPRPKPISEAVSFVKEQMAGIDSKEAETTKEEDSADGRTADKLRELKELHEDGILSEEEFESKKEELLNDF